LFGQYVIKLENKEVLLLTDSNTMLKFSDH